MSQWLQLIGKARVNEKRRTLNQCLLVEGAHPIRLDIETSLRRRFPKVDISRFYLSRPNAELQKFAWQPIDLIVVTCTNTVQMPPLSWLSSLKYTAQPPLVLVLSLHPAQGRTSLWHGAHAYLPLNCTANEFAAKLDTLLALDYHLTHYPLDLPDWRCSDVLHHSDNSVLFTAENNEGKQAVIKRFKINIEHTAPELVETCLQDMCTLKTLGNPYLVTLFDVGIQYNSIYIIMEYVTGTTLKYTLSESPLPALSQRLMWFTQITQALAAIHTVGLVHRDLKTSNIFIRDDGNVVLLDFGMETQFLLDSGFLNANEIYSTPYYISPELILGEAASPSSDLYALGVVLFELLTGTKPYEAHSLSELLRKHALAPIPLLPAELRPFQPLINGLLAKFPEDRLESTQEVVCLLQELLIKKSN